MLDDFLNDDDEITTFLDELEEDYDDGGNGAPQVGFLGMTPFQRFVVSILFFLMVVVAGSFCLLITGSISLPF
jgi:hypothetical protein